MPNWVRNRITVTGGNAEDIIRKHIVTNEDGNQVFDFNTLIKMPEDLLLEKGSRSEDGIKLYIGKICTSEKSVLISKQSVHLPTS